MTNDYSKIPKFLRRLFRETSDPTNDNIVWSEDGDRLRILNKEGFIKNTLQTLSRTREYSGFIRQLNIYGFVKTKNEKNDDIEEYYNCFFKRDQPSLMGFIKREQKSKKGDSKLNIPSLESSINYLTNANFRLSNEVAQLKERIDKQDRTINGLLDILGRVFRTGAQSMGYETHTVQPKPDFFMKYGLPGDKTDAGESKQLSLFEQQPSHVFKKTKSSEERKSEDKSTEAYADMSNIFF